MKKILLILIFLIMVFSLTLANNTNFYWYRTSDAEDNKAFEVTTFQISPDDGIILIAVGGDYNAFGKSTNIFTSSDGIKWIERPGTGWNIDHLTSISGNSEGFVAGGHNGSLNSLPVGAIVNSKTAEEWQSSILTGSAFLDIIWAEEAGKYVAVGDYGAEGIRTSEDGKAWTNFMTTGANLYGVAYGDGKFVAVGEWGNGGIYSSIDGIHWLKETNSTSRDYHGIDYGNSRFVAVGDGIISYLPDATGEWKTASGFSTYHTLNSVLWNGKQYVAVGDTSYVAGKTQAIIYTSSDGINWIRRDSGTNINLQDITFSKALGAYFAVGDKVVLRSIDGKTWEKLDTVDTAGKDLFMDLESIYASPTTDPGLTPRWAVFSIDGKIKLTGSSSIEPLDPSNISGQMGTNAFEKTGSEYPIILGQGPQSVLSPPSNFYFGPDANRDQLVADINGGDEAIARVNALKTESQISEEIQEFPTPRWLAFEEPGVLNFYNRGSFEAGWSGGPFELSDKDSGFYDSFVVKSNMTIKVYDKDVVILTNVFDVRGSGSQADIRIERYGTGKVFILVNNTLSLTADAKIYSYDAEGNQIQYDDNLYLFYNGSNKMTGWPQFQFSGLFYIKKAPIKIGGSTKVSGLVAGGNGAVTVDGAGISSKFIYAPNANITFNNHGQVNGSVIGNTIEMLNDGKIYYELVDVPKPKIPDLQPSNDWIILIVDGYDLQDKGFDIRGNVLVWQTDYVYENPKGKPQKIDGDIIVNAFIKGYKPEDMDPHNTGVIIEEAFALPECWGTYTKSEDYTDQLTSGKKTDYELKINGTPTIPGNMFIMSSGSITIDGNFTLEGAIFAPNASELVFQNNPTIKNGLCAPKALVDFKGSIKIHNKVYIRFLDMNGSAEIYKIEN